MWAAAQKREADSDGQYSSDSEDEKDVKLRMQQQNGAGGVVADGFLGRLRSDGAAAGGGGGGNFGEVDMASVAGGFLSGNYALGHVSMYDIANSINEGGRLSTTSVSDDVV